MTACFFFYIDVQSGSCSKCRILNILKISIKDVNWKKRNRVEKEKDSAIKDAKAVLAVDVFLKINVVC